MSIIELAYFLEAYQHKTLDELSELVRIENNFFLSDEDEALHAYLREFLRPFFDFKRNPDVAGKMLFEQMALFYESDAIKKSDNAAICWMLFFKKQLNKHTSCLSYVALAEDFFYEPNRFFGFLYYLLDQGICPTVIMETHIIQRFFQYNCDFTNSEESVAGQFLALFDCVGREKTTLLLDAIVNTEIMIRKQFAIQISRNTEKKWSLKMVPSRTLQIAYDLPLFSCDTPQDMMSVYHCFGADFIGKIDFSKKNIQSVFSGFLWQLFLSYHADVGKLFYFVLNKLPFAPMKTIFLNLFDRAIAEKSEFSELLQQVPAFIFAMLLGAARDRDGEADFILSFNGPEDLRAFFSDNNITIASPHAHIMMCFLRRSAESYSDDKKLKIFFTLFDFIGRTAVENKNELESDSAIYGVSLKWLEVLLTLPKLSKAVAAYLVELNQPVFQKIKEGADFSAVSAVWSLPVINVFKRLCPDLFMSAESLGSTHALKVMMLKHQWTSALSLARERSISAESLCRFDFSFAAFSQADQMPSVEIQVGLLVDLLKNTNDKRLMVFCIDYLENTLAFSGWVQKIAFSKSPNMAIIQKVICFLFEIDLDLLRGDFAEHIKKNACRFLTNRGAGILLCLLLASGRSFEDKYVVCAYLCRRTTDYESLAAVFQTLPEDSTARRDLIATVIAKQLNAASRGIFSAAASLSWWHNKPCDAFYIACALKIIGREYQGSRKARSEHLWVYDNAWLEKTKLFLRESRGTQETSRLNQALLELVAQAEGVRSVSMGAIFQQLNPPVRANDVRVFTP